METLALLSTPAVVHGYVKSLARVLHLEAVVVGVGETGHALPATGSVVPEIYRDSNACLCTNLMLYISHTYEFISNLFMTQRKWKLCCK